MPTIRLLDRTERIRTNNLPVPTPHPPPQKDNSTPTPNKPSEWNFIDAIMLEGLNLHSTSTNDSESSRSDDSNSTSDSESSRSDDSEITQPSPPSSPVARPPPTLLPTRITTRATLEIYHQTPKEQLVEIPLPSAMQVIQRAVDQGSLNISGPLLRSRRFAKITLKNPTQAAKHADMLLIAGMQATLSTLALTSPVEPRNTINATISNLEKELTHRMHLDCVSWIERWILHRELTVGSDATAFLEECKMENGGVEALVDCGEVVVKVLVGLVVWVWGINLDWERWTRWRAGLAVPNRNM